MYSCARMNGQHQVGPTTQQVTFDPTTNQQMLRNYNGHHYQTANPGAQPRAYMIPTDRPQSNFGTERWQHQPATCSNTPYYHVSHNNVQNPSSIVQIGNTPSNGIIGLLVSPVNTLSQNSSGWTQSNTIQPNTQNFLFANENHSAIMNGTGMTKEKPVQMYNNPKSVASHAAQVPYTTASTSLTYQNKAWKDTQGSATGEQKRMGSNQYHGQNYIPNQQYLTRAPPSYHSAVPHIVHKKSATVKSPPNVNVLHMITTGPKQQQCASQQNLASAKRREVTPPVRSNSDTSQVRYRPLSQLEAMAKARKESPLLMDLLDNLSGQKNNTQSSTANDVMICESETSVTTNPAVPSSPGHTASKVVCVVQPLSQESCMVPRHNTPSKEVNQDTANTGTEECFRNEVQSFAADVTEKTKAAASRELPDSCRVSLEIQNQSASHELARSKHDRVSSSDSPAHQPVPQKKLCPDNIGSNPAVDMQIDHEVVPTSKEPESRCGEKDTNELPLDPKSFDLSTLPTVQWKADALNQFIQSWEGSQMKSYCGGSQLKLNRNSPVKTIVELYWNGVCEELVNSFRLGKCSDLLATTQAFYECYVTDDSVILSEVKKNNLKHFHVLKNDEVYKAQPYTSSWLNINEQLDDIDKEFGIPLSLKHHHHAPENQSKSDNVLTLKKLPVQKEREKLNKASCDNKLQPEETERNQTLAKEVTSKPPTSNNMDAEDSGDEYCSFEIQVLPPEEAKIIFERAQSETSQSRETGSLQSKDIQIIDLTNDSMEDSALTRMDKFCCILKWKQTALGSDMSSSSQCGCDVGALTPDKDGNTENENLQFVGSSDSTLNEESPVMDGENNAKIPTLSWIEEISDDDDDSLIFISQDEAVSSNIDTCNPPQDCNEDCGEAHQESTKSDHSTSSVPCDEPQVAKKMLPLREDCGQAVLTSQESPREVTSCQTTPSVSDKEDQKRKRKRHDEKLPPRNKLKKHKTQFATKSASSVSQGTTVKLALFGSSSQRAALVGCQKRQTSQTLHNTARPPRTLHVNLSSDKREPPASPNQDYSVKKLIYERWSLPPTRISHSNKPGRYMTPSNGPSNHKELSDFSSEMMKNGKAKHLKNVKRKNPFKVGRRGVFKLKRLDCDRTNAESRSPDIVGTKNALKFSVLPETFNFKDGQNGTDETSNGFSDKSNHKSKKQAVTHTSASGTWNPPSEKKYVPFGQSSARKSSNVFREFQKKYRKKMPTSLSK